MMKYLSVAYCYPSDVQHLYDPSPYRMNYEYLCFTGPSHAPSVSGPVTLERITCENCKAIYAIQIQVAETNGLTRDDLYRLEVGLWNKYAIRQTEAQGLIDRGLFQSVDSVNAGYIMWRLTEEGIAIASAAWREPYRKYGTGNTPGSRTARSDAAGGAVPVAGEGGVAGDE